MTRALHVIAQSAILVQLCLKLLTQTDAKSASSENVEFLRKVVAPVTVPGLEDKQRKTLENKQNTIRKLSAEDIAAEKKARKERRKERQARAEEIQMKNEVHKQRPRKLEKMPQEHIERELNWFSSGGNGQVSSISEGFLADPSEEYDKWAQAYRFLGAYIDCDHGWGEEGGSHDNGGGNNGGGGACSRWMIWAAYYYPYYQGMEYEEYFGDGNGGEAVSPLDCHLPGSEWKLLGVYRQEHYQYIEQISKHLWAIDEEEYVVALAGLAYMTDDECYLVGQADDGEYLYVGVAPRKLGLSEVALYTENECIIEDASGADPTEFIAGSDLNLGSKDQGDYDPTYLYDYWYDAQEPTLTSLNTVYKEFQYCTTCVDYPTYQDGYFIGDYGTDDDDLINQCWKFWSHDSFMCEDDCLSKASSQGTILQIQYGDRSYGYTPSEWYQGYATASAIAKESGGSSTESLESPLARLLANAFLTLSFLLFVATFLAFAVARRSRYRESRSSRSRRLLDDDHGSRRSGSRRRSKSRSKGGDGLFKDGGRSSSRSRARSSRSSSRKRQQYDPEE